MAFKFIKQNNYNDCAHACLTMVINSLQNSNYSLDEFKIKNSLSDTELNFVEIEKILLNYKIDFLAYNATIDQIISNKPKTPIILNVITKEGIEHFILVLDIKRKYFLVADPSKNQTQWLNINQINEMYLGYFGIFKKVETFKFKTNSILNWLFILKSQTLNILQIIFFSIFFDILILLSSTFTRAYFSNIQVEDKGFWFKFFLMYSIIFLVIAILNYILEKIKNNFIKNINHKTIMLYFSKLIDIDCEKYMSIKKQEWIKKIKDIQILNSYIFTLVVIFPLKTLFFILSIILIGISSQLVLSLFIFENFIYLLISLISFYYYKNNSYSEKIVENNFSNLFADVIDGFEQIKTKKIEKIKLVELENLYLKLEKNQIDQNNLSLNIESIKFILSKIFYLLFFFIGILLIGNKKVNSADIIFFLTISIYIPSFSSTIKGIICDYSRSKIAYDDLSILFLDENKIQKPKINKISSIEMININKFFSKNILIKNFSHKFTKNTFIFGKSGCGKTSILKILCGIYKKYEGKILINQLNYDEIDQSSVTDKIYYLGQYDYLFKGTIFDNIRQFKNNIDLNILKEFGLIEILQEYDLRLDKEIFQNGENLSKGQRQIINFMSLFFVNFDVLLLDEPLSNVDKKLAIKLFELLLEKKKDKLIIMCDHDLNYKKYFNEVININEKN